MMVLYIVYIAIYLVILIENTVIYEIFKLQIIKKITNSQIYRHNGHLIIVQIFYIYFFKLNYLK